MKNSSIADSTESSCKTKLGIDDDFYFKLLPETFLLALSELCTTLWLHYAAWFCLFADSILRVESASLPLGPLQCTEYSSRCLTKVGENVSEMSKSFLLI